MITVKRILPHLGNEIERPMCIAYFVLRITFLNIMLLKSAVREAGFCGNDVELEARQMQMKSWNCQLLIIPSLANHQMARGHSILICRREINIYTTLCCKIKNLSLAEYIVYIRHVVNVSYNA